MATVADMSQSAARAMALTFLHDAAQAIVAAERVLRASGAITPADSISHELTAAAMKVSGMVQRVSECQPRADIHGDLQFR